MQRRSRPRKHGQGYGALLLRIFASFKTFDMHLAISATDGFKITHTLMIFAVTSSRNSNKMLLLLNKRIALLRVIMELEAQSTFGWETVDLKYQII